MVHVHLITLLAHSSAVTSGAWREDNRKTNCNAPAVAPSSPLQANGAAMVKSPGQTPLPCRTGALSEEDSCRILSF